MTAATTRGRRARTTRRAGPARRCSRRCATPSAAGRRSCSTSAAAPATTRRRSPRRLAPTVLDRSPACSSTPGQGPRTSRRRAALPFADHSFDAVMLVAMIHHVDDPARALAEARRVLRPRRPPRADGVHARGHRRLVVLDYFPASRPWMYETHPRSTSCSREPTRRRAHAGRLPDMLDGSMAALLGHPERLLEAERRSQTSFFERMERDHPEGLQRRAGTARVESWRRRAPRQQWRREHDRAGKADASRAAMSERPAPADAGVYQR